MRAVNDLPEKDNHNVEEVIDGPVDASDDGLQLLIRPRKRVGPLAMQGRQQACETAIDEGTAPGAVETEKSQRIDSDS